MTSQLLEIEGTWEEILAQSEKLAGCRVRITVISEEPEYIEDLKDEIRWDESFQKTQPQLVAAAQRAKQEIAEGKAQEMKLNEL